MIPKIIHYCWFGTNKKNETIQNCIESWNKYLPDYEIILWNETNSPMNHPWVKKSYAIQKYAFVADYVRFFALKKFGGIYLDTDMMIVKPLDPLLENDFFIGKETNTKISFGIFGSRKNHNLLDIILDKYDRTEIDLESPQIITDLISPILETEKERINIYPKDYFYPIYYTELEKIKSYKNHLKKETYAIHMWNKSWYNEINYIWTSEYKKALLLIFKTVIKKPNQPRSYYIKIVYALKEKLIKNLRR